MAYEPFIGEIMIFAGNFAPSGWAFCNGQLLPINQNVALYSIIGTTYGGNGVSTFGLPDLRGRMPIGFGSTPGEFINLGTVGGQNVADLSPVNIPVPEEEEEQLIHYVSQTPTIPTVPPYLALNFCIALQGLYPTRW